MRSFTVYRKKILDIFLDHLNTQNENKNFVIKVKDQSKLQTPVFARSDKQKPKCIRTSRCLNVFSQHYSSQKKSLL